MASSTKGQSPRETAEAKFAASERHDAQFFRERKEREATNLARTLQLKALRLAKEAEERAAGAGQKPPKRKTAKSPPSS